MVDSGLLTTDTGKHPQQTTTNSTSNKAYGWSIVAQLCTFI
jgi:hypothetical protein